jgi:hypothetical protein
MKGLVYSGPNDPAISKGRREAWERRNVPQERRQEWVDDHNRRWAIVGRCQTCNEPLIAGEALAHSMMHVPSRLRPLLRQYAGLRPEERNQLRELLDAAPL